MSGVVVMVRDKYAVRLAPEQREELQNLIRVGKNSARVTARARILLKSDDGWAAPGVAEALDVSLGKEATELRRQHQCEVDPVVRTGSRWN